MAAGASREEAEKNVYEAIEMYIKGLLEDKLPIPESKSFAEYIAVAEKSGMEQTASVPCIFPPQNVPPIFQQSRPCLGFAGHTPISLAFIPLTSLPHFLNSQQFFAAIINYLLNSHIYLLCCEKNVNQH